MIKILVIGNGFDKAHGLKTGYGDFLNWVTCISAGEIYRKNRVLTITEDELQEYEDFRVNNPKEFKETVEMLGNFWILYFDKRKINIGDKWLDFESEIEHLTKDVYEWVKQDSIRLASYKLRRLCSNETDIPNFVNEKELFEWMNSQLRDLTRFLEIYLCKCANKTINKDARMDLFTSIKANKLLSFNYTSTYQDVYNKSIKTDYIHGKAKMEHSGEVCNLVLGFDDHYFETVDIIPELIPFEKYYQRIVNRNSNNYFEWIDAKDKNGNPEAKEIHFYGHSFSPADGDIIKLLIQAENTKTIIYYRHDYESDRASIIKNLALILTPNDLIKRAGGNNPTIEFIPV